MKRNATLDIARLLAAFGIVLFHAGAPGSRIGYAALPFFLMLLIVLGLPAAARHPFRDFAANRARRLLWPWVIWSGVYAGLKLIEVGLIHRTLSEEFSLSMLLTGPAIHLWFLPFAFVWSLALPPLARLWGRLTTEHLPALGLLLALALASTGLQQAGPLPVPLAQWSYALPAVFIGMALGLSQDKPGLIMAVALGILLCGGIAYAIGWIAGLLQLGLACAALLLCLTVKREETAFSRLCARASMAVYLVHPLIISILDRATALPPNSLALALSAMAGSLAFALALNYTLDQRQKAGSEA